MRDDEQQVYVDRDVRADQCRKHRQQRQQREERNASHHYGNHVRRERGRGELAMTRQVREVHEAGCTQRQQRHAVDFAREHQVLVIADEIGGERQEADQQQVTEVYPDQGSIGVNDEMELDVVVDPVHSDDDEADHVDDEVPFEAQQVLPQLAVGRGGQVIRKLEVEYEERQRD